MCMCMYVYVHTHVCVLCVHAFFLVERCVGPSCKYIKGYQCVHVSWMDFREEEIIFIIHIYNYIFIILYIIVIYVYVCTHNVKLIVFFLNTENYGI